MTALTEAITLAATSGGGATVAKVAWDVVAGAVELLAIIRTIRVPAHAWTYKRWSKAAAIALAGWGTITIGVLALPIGALAVIWHTRTLARALIATPAVPDLPYAQGDPEAGERS